MTSARPLKDVFADLLGAGDGARPDPGEALAAAGHADLPPDLVAEAVVSYADTAPVEVAEHLAPYVTSHSGVPTVDEPVPDSDEGALVPDLATLGDLFAGAPAGPDAVLDGPDGPGVDLGGTDATVGDEPPAFNGLDEVAGFAPAGPRAELLDEGDDVAALDFGGGAADPAAVEQPATYLPEPDDSAVDEGRPDGGAEPSTDPDDARDALPLDLSLPGPDRGGDGSGDAADDDGSDDGTDPAGLDG